MGCRGGVSGYPDTRKPAQHGLLHRRAPALFKRGQNPHKALNRPAAKGSPQDVGEVGLTDADVFGGGGLRQAMCLDETVQHNHDL